MGSNGNGRLSLTLREEDCANVFLSYGRCIEIECVFATPDRVQLALRPPEAEEGFLVRRENGVCRPMHHGVDLLSMIAGERVWMHTPDDTEIEIKCTGIDWDRTTLSFDAPREYRISRDMRDDEITGKE